MDRLSLRASDAIVEAFVDASRNALAMTSADAATSFTPSSPARSPPSRSSRSACGRCCRSRSRCCANCIWPLEELVAQPAHRLGIRLWPVRRRAQLDRDRLHLPVEHAGLARLGRGRPAVASISPSIRRSRPASPGALAATDRVVLVIVLGGAWAITEWLRGTMFTGFPWNPAAAVARADAADHDHAADRHLRPFRPGRAARRRSVARILPEMASARRHPRRDGLPLGPALVAGSAGSADRPATSASSSRTSARRTSGGPASTRKPRGGWRRCRARRRDEPRLLLWPEAAITDPLEDARTDGHQAFAQVPAHPRRLAARPRRPCC